jgi:type II secretory pathway component PulF
MAELTLQAKIGHKLKKLQFGMKAQLAFLEDFSHLVEDGIPPNKAIEMLARASKGVSKEVAASIAANISTGKPLAEGMKEWFAFNVVEIIRIGEEGGALGETIQSAINMMSSRSSTIGAFTGAIAYPATVVLIACLVILYLNKSVFTQFLTIKPMEQWPEAGKRLVGVAHFIQSWWWAAIVIVIAFVIVLQLIMKNYVGVLRPALDKFFPFTMYKQFVASHVLETLGLLVANGVVFKSALIIMQHKVSPYLAMHLSRMEHLMGKGKGNIADVLDTGLINENDLMRLRILAEVKGFEHGLIRLGIRGTEQGMRTLKTIAKIIAGVLMIVGTSLIMVAINGVYQTGMAMGSQ